MLYYYNELALKALKNNKAFTNKLTIFRRQVERVSEGSGQSSFELIADESTWKRLLHKLPSGLVIVG